MQLFGTSGIRRLADRNLVELALKVGMAVGEVYDDVVVGRDTRTSSEAIRLAFVSGLLTAGARCADAGVVPTPTLAFAVKRSGVGAMITASHNPPEYNGIKLLNPDGSAFNAAQRQQIEDALSGDSLLAASWDELKSSVAHSGAIENHVERILKDFPKKLELKVVLDCGCGATSVITPYLLRKLGCEVVALNCYPSGFFPHPVEPTEANLGDLMRATREFGADLGIAHDGDGDRMMAIDDKGRFIPGDKLLILLARQAGAKEIVTTIDASMAVDEMGFTVTRTRVGDIYVSEELKNAGDFGGEPSGSWIFPNVSLCPDGVYAAAQMVAIASQQRLSQSVDRIPSYPLLRGSLNGHSLAMADLAKQLLALKPLAISHADGIRLNLADGWLLIRASGTEPKTRITAEARSEARARQLYDGGIKIIQACMKDK